MAQHGHLTRKEKKDIRIKRRKLRKDLKRRGIRSRKEFEIIAQQMGLVYGGKKVGLLGLWWLFVDTFGMAGVAALAGVVAAAMLVTYQYAKLYTQKDKFTIALNGSMSKIGFQLSETEDFANPQVRLSAQGIQEVNAMSVADLPQDLDNYEGNHNGENYMAYTFWVKNAGEKTVNYNWTMDVYEMTQDLGQALWIMVYDEGKQTIYTQAPEGAAAEHLSGYGEWPLYDQAANPSAQYYTAGNGSKGIMTTPYRERQVVASGGAAEFEPEEKHKYTVVMWVEGDDPECTNDKLGATCSMKFQFSVEGEDEGIFDNLLTDKDAYVEDTKEKEKNNPFTNWLSNLFK